MDKIGWFGSRSGYEMLPKFLPKKSICVTTRNGIVFRTLGKFYSLFNSLPPRNQSVSFAELEFLMRTVFHRETVRHILYGEPHLQFIGKQGNLPTSWIVTLHLPPSQWSDMDRNMLKSINSAIVLYQRDIPFFEEFVGSGRVRFVHYGVDSDFFSPQSSPPEKRVLFAGAYLRNTQMLGRVVKRLLATNPDINFDFLVPLHARRQEGISELEGHPSIKWHAGLSDEQLRELYRRSYLLLLPMNESGANTAIVESLACGLPIVTTDVGGIRDYGGNEVFPIVANNDDDHMLRLVDRYLSDPALRMDIAEKGRAFAEKTLAWPVVANEHYAAYVDLVN